MNSQIRKFIIQYVDEYTRTIKNIEGVATIAEINDLIIQNKGQVKYIRTLDIHRSFTEKLKMLSNAQ